jgi:uncharacterized protein DUF397
MGDRDLRRAQWRTSTYSASGSTCVEVARNLPGMVAVRDSKDRHGPVLIFTPDEWRTFLTRIQHVTRGPGELT